MIEPTEKTKTIYVQDADWRALGYRTQTDYDADMAMRACTKIEAEKPESSEQVAA